MKKTVFTLFAITLALTGCKNTVYEQGRDAVDGSRVERPLEYWRQPEV